MKSKFLKHQQNIDDDVIISSVIEHIYAETNVDMYQDTMEAFIPKEDFNTLIMDYLYIFWKPARKHIYKIRCSIEND